jgi:predicted DsbA family dithiol-disulfide isomerase
MEGQQISYQDMRYALGIPLHRKEQEVYGEEMEIYEMGKRWLEDQIFDQEARQSGVDTLRYSKRRSHHLKELKKKLGVRLDLDRPKPMEPVYTPVAIPSRKGTIEPGKARIVVFSDFTCPHCQEAHSLIKKTLSPFSDFIHLEKRHVSWSSKGKKAASAAFCAELQGKYDAYADLLFKNPNDLDQDSFLQHAETIGLDLSKFERCFESEPAKEIVKENMRLAQRIGLRGLPTFIVNSYFITGWQEEAFLDLLKREMDDSVKGN